MGTTVCCIVPTQKLAADVVSSLKTAGFRDADISILLHDKAGTPVSAAAAHADAPKAAANADAAASAKPQTLAGTKPLTVAGIGSVLAAGPIVAALGNPGTGDIPGVLVGMGLSEFDARRCGGQLKHDSVLLAALAENTDHISRARQIFGKAHATDISTGSPMSSAASPTPPKEPSVTTGATPGAARPGVAPMAAASS